MDFAILGGGRWGTAIASHLGRIGHRVVVFDINEGAVRLINEGKNPYFQDAVIPPTVKASTRVNESSQFPVLVCALPVQKVREVFSSLSLKHHIVINASKGLEITTFKRVSEVIRELNPSVEILALSGPSFAAEVVKGFPTALVLAYCGDKEVAEELQREINSENFRIYLSEDITGVELGGALKNVIAIACGISDGMGYGHNARAGLITRGLAEMVRIGVRLGAKGETFYGLSGLGDLVLTATSDLSRNRTFGILIGKGLSPGEALMKIGQTVEGEKTVRPLRELCKKLGIDAPITDAVYRVVVEGHNLIEVVRSLLTRLPKEENPLGS